MEPERVSARDAGHMPLVTSCGNSVVSDPRVLILLLEYQWYGWDWAPWNSPPFTEHRQLLNSLDVFPFLRGGNEGSELVQWPGGQRFLKTSGVGPRRQQERLVLDVMMEFPNRTEL